MCDMFFRGTYSKCGIIEKKYHNNDLKFSKSTGTMNTYMYFDVKYADGLYEQIKVITNTYYKNSQGDKVCFSFPKERKQNFPSFFVGCLFLVIDIVLIFIGLCYIISVIWDLLGNKEQDENIEKKIN